MWENIKALAKEAAIGALYWLGMVVVSTLLALVLNGALKTQ